MATEIGYEAVTDMFNAAIEIIRQRHPKLSKLDSATGDGDHGTTMLRSMESVAKTIEGKAGATDIKDLLYSIGWDIMCADGGSTGPLLGSLFMGMSETLEDAADTIDAQGIASSFESGLTKMQKQSKAQVGDKTMMDALIPAVEALKGNIASGDISQMFQEAKQASADGAKATEKMIAKFGRARNLGERTIGHIDPGATSISYLFEAFASSLVS